MGLPTTCPLPAAGRAGVGSFPPPSPGGEGWGEGANLLVATRLWMGCRNPRKQPQRVLQKDHSLIGICDWQRLNKRNVVDHAAQRPIRAEQQFPRVLRCNRQQDRIDLTFPAPVYHASMGQAGYVRVDIGTR